MSNNKSDAATDTATNDGYHFGKLTSKQIQELHTWFLSMITDNNPAKVTVPPHFYRPLLAYSQMQSLGMTLIDLTPWNIPANLVDYFADIWIANRMATLAAARLHSHDSRSSAPSSFGRIVKGTHHSGNT